MVGNAPQAANADVHRDGLGMVPGDKSGTSYAKIK
jgi:hypothetical protein